MRKIPYWCHALAILCIGELLFFIVGLNTLPANGAYWSMGSENLCVTFIVPGSPEEHAGLQAGDTLRSVNGMIPEAYFAWKTSWTIPAGRVVKYEVVRNGATLSFDVHTISIWNESPYFWTAYYCCLFLIVLLGLFVLHERAHEKSARLFFVLSQVYAVSLNYWINVGDPGSVLRVALFLTVATFVSPVVFHFLLTFPQAFFTPRIQRRVLAIGYVSGSMVALAVTIPLVLFSISRTPDASHLYGNAIQAGRYWMGGTAGFIVLFVLRRYFKKAIVTKLQFRWMTIGIVTGMSTWIIHGFFYEDLILPLEETIPHLNYVIGLISAFALLLSFGYALFRHRLWDIEPFLKRGALYAGTSIILAAIYLVVVSFAEALLQTGTTGTRLIGIAGSALAFVPLREFLQQRIDRFFHRENYNAGQAAIEFDEQLTGVYDKPELYRRILQQLDRILHLKIASLYAREEAGLFCCVASVSLTLDSVPQRIEVNPAFEKHLIAQRTFNLIEMSGEPAAKSLHDSGFELMFAVLYKNRIQCLIVCGPKLSERAYSHQDTQLLQLLAQRSATLLAAADLHRNELERQVALERERTRISRDMHDELGANLTSLSMMTEFARASLSDPAQAERQLLKAGDIASETLRKLDEIVWAVNPRADSLASLGAYISEYAQEFFAASTIRVRFDYPDHIPNIALTSDVRHHLFLVVKEALTNILKHSQATESSIKLQVPDGTIVVEVTDNGKGFCASAATVLANGLTNMRSRIESIGGTLNVISEQSKGTRVRIEVPQPVPDN